MATTTDGLTGPEAVALPGGAGFPPEPPRAYRAEHAAWRPPLGPVRKTIREIGFDLITAGVVVLLFVVYQLWGTGFAEASSQAKLKTQFKGPVAASTTPGPSAGTTVPAGASSGDGSTIGGQSAVPVAGPPEGAAVAHLVIPKLGLDKYVVEGIGDTDLEQGPGHYPGTPMPGEPGNAAIAGHRTTYGAPFYNLNELNTGDQIFVTTKAGQFLYVVNGSQVVKPSDVAVIAATPDNRLTLTTCNPRFEATTRLIVTAKLTSLPVVPPPTIAPRPVEVKVNLGSGDRSAWPPALLWGMVAGGLWLLVRLWAMRRRYWKWIPFLVGIPVCFVPLWFVFENVIRLLPNNI